MESFLAANPFADSTKDERVKQHSAQKKAYVGAEEQRTKLASLKRNILGTYDTLMYIMHILNLTHQF
jgi:hypothetical protein